MVLRNTYSMQFRSSAASSSRLSSHSLDTSIEARCGLNIWLQVDVKILISFDAYISFTDDNNDLS